MQRITVSCFLERYFEGACKMITERRVSSRVLGFVAIGLPLILCGCQSGHEDGADKLVKMLETAPSHEVQVSTLPGAPEGASLVVVCPYTPAESVVAELNTVAPGPEFNEVTTSNSDAETLWHWAKPTRGIVETWRVARTVDPCSAGGLQLATGFAPGDTLRFTQRDGRWVVQ